MKGSSDGSVVAAPAVGRSAASRPASRSQSSSGLLSKTSRWAGLAPWPSRAFTSDSACSTSWPAAERSISAATFTSSRNRATARSTSAAASRRISPSWPPTWATVSSSSSRMIRNVECRLSAGPNSSSSIGSSRAASAVRARSIAGDGRASGDSAQDSTRVSRAREAASPTWRSGSVSAEAVRPATNT